MTTRTQREHDAATTRAHELEGFRLWLAGYLAGSAMHLDDTHVEIFTTGEDYLPTFAVRRGRLALIVHIDAEISP